MTNRKIRIALIGTVGLPAKYGGFETLADHLVRNLGDKYDMTVYCSKKRYSKQERSGKYLNAKLKYLPFNANGIQSIPYDSISIMHAACSCDALLILGVAGAWILPFIRLFTTKRIIISIDGIEWKRDKWNLLAKWYLWWAEKIAVRYSHIDISDNESIQDYTAYRYGSLSRVIEYGTDHILKVSPTFEDKKKYPFVKHPYAFKVCRIEPENNVHMILEAFEVLYQHSLVIIGNWENSTYGRNLRDRFNSRKNIILLDPIYDQCTLDMIRGSAIVYVHGHSAGGTNPSLVEAMYHGLPVITYGVSYNRTTTEHKALYFRNKKDIIDIIRNVEVKTLKEMGKAMKEIAGRRYTWNIVAEKYDHLIQKCMNEKKKPGIQPSLARLNEQLLISYDAGHLKYQNGFFEKRKIN